MAAVSPFRGWRYNQETVGDMASLLCPPYDMINEENQEALKRQNQYNVIHLEAGEGLDWNTSAKEQYAATSNLFDRWRQDGVLLQDESPSYYLMRHSFSFCGKKMVRVGLIASVGLEANERDGGAGLCSSLQQHEALKAESVRYAQTTCTVRQGFTPRKR